MDKAKVKMIEYCQSKSPESLKKFIHKAIDDLNSMINFSNPKHAVSKVIQYAGYLACIEKEERDYKKSKIATITFISAHELVKENLLYVRSLRKALFGTETPPFPFSFDTPDNWEKAIDWLKEEEKKESSPIRKEIKKKEEERLKVKSELLVVLKKYSELTHCKWEIKSKKNNIHYPGRNGYIEKKPVWDDTKLGDLEKGVKIIFKETNFPKASILMFILTGIEPLVPSFSLSEEISTGKKSISIDIYKNLHSNESLSLNRYIKKMTKVRIKELSKNQQEIYDMIEEEGGVPPEGKMKFYGKILKKWNELHPRKQMSTPDFIRMNYRRTLVHLERTRRLEPSLILEK